MIRWIIAVIGSLVIWALTFDFLFDYNRLALSIVIALVAGLIAALILRPRPGFQPGILIQLIIPAVVVAGVLFVASYVVPKRSCPGPVQVTISCAPTPTAPDICINRGGDIEWIVPAGYTAKVHDFKKKYVFIYLKNDPLVSPPPEGNNQAPIQGKVRNDKDGKFKYSITCTQGTQSKIIDPMIDIPKN